MKVVKLGDGVFGACGPRESGGVPMETTTRTGKRHFLALGEWTMSRRASTADGKMLQGLALLTCSANSINGCQESDSASTRTNLAP